MQITEINVSAGRVVSHPVEQYSNLKPMVSLKAVLNEGDDYEQCVKDLQAKAEGLVEDHANQLKKHIRDMHYLSEKEREAKRLEDSIAAGQKRLADIRSEIPLMLSGELDTENEDKADDIDW
jgi:uncharacterized protein YbaR (Trm112 family)